MRIFSPLLICFSLIISNAAAANFDATIPVIDMNDFYSAENHQKFIQGLDEAFKKVGFVAVINSRVDKQVLDNAYAANKAFYKQDLSIKMLSHNPKLNAQRGYIPSETALGQSKKDYKEFFHVAREYPEDVLAKHGYAKNIWPQNEQFKSSMLQLISALDEYAQVIEQALSECIGENKDFFSNLTHHGSFLLRSIHYPSNPPPDTFWSAAHTDIDLFTILPRVTAEGLQVLNAKNEWVDVVVPENAFILNAGDMLQNITNGVYKSAKHRVVSKDATKERCSIVAFVHPKPNDRIDPLPQFITQVGKRNFAYVSMRELLFERLIDLGAHTDELLKQFAESGAIERLIDVNRASPNALRALVDANLANTRVKETLAKSNR